MNTMTEDQIERAVERKTNSADNAFMNGILSQEEYDFHMTEINKWAENQYTKIVKNYR